MAGRLALRLAVAPATRLLTAFFGAPSPPPVVSNITGYQYFEMKKSLKLCKASL